MNKRHTIKLFICWVIVIVFASAAHHIYDSLCHLNKCVEENIFDSAIVGFSIFLFLILSKDKSETKYTISEIFQDIKKEIEKKRIKMQIKWNASI